MFYTLPHNPEVLQAYCELDRDDRYERRLAAPQFKLWGRLNKLFDRDQPEPDAADDQPETRDPDTRDEDERRTEALIQATKWGL